MRKAVSDWLEINAYPFNDIKQVSLYFLNRRTSRKETNTVKFISDGKVISAQSVKYGNAAVAPENPTKADDEQYFYTFKGWKKDFGNIVSDLEVEAQFEEHLKTVSDVSVPNSSEPEKEVSSTASEISENSSTSSQPESSVPESSVEESRNNVSTGQSDDISLLSLIHI